MPTWVYLIIALGSVVGGLIGWFLKQLLTLRTSKGLTLKNKREAFSLVQDERDEALRQTARVTEKNKELQNQLRQIEEKRESLPQQDIERIAEEPEQLTAETDVLEPPASVDDSGSGEAFINAINTLEEGDYEEGMDLLRQYLQAESGSKIDRIGHEAFGMYWARTYGVYRAMDDLRRLMDEHPKNSQARLYFARALTYVGEHQEARQALKEGLRLAADDEAEITNFTIRSAEILRQQDRHVEALEWIRATANQVTSSDLKANLYIAAGLTYESQEDFRHAFTMYERALHHDPSNTELRFRLAYAYQKKSAPMFAFYHYRMLLGVKKHGLAMNNAGVAANDLSLPTTSTAYYRLAEKEGNTLAAANLAQRLIDKGFITEAEQILSEADSKTDVHENVYAEKARIAKERGEETEKIKSVEEAVERVRKWRHKYAEAMLRQVPDPVSLTGNYSGKPGRVILSVSDDGTVTGELQLVLTAVINNAELSMTDKAEIKGQLEGAGIKISWRVIPPEKTTSSPALGGGLFGGFGSSIPPRSEQGFLIIDGDQLKGYSTPDGGKLDPAESPVWTEWSLTKESSVIPELIARPDPPTPP